MKQLAGKETNALIVSRLEQKRVEESDNWTMCPELQMDANAALCLLDVFCK